ncbi:hypothetical protein AVEN_204793-1 [Araneus ventricosus]|uniref:Uncharacterized protein n=1 Tax=Araneus ventricosus TaxID=182803 RepID=A0A4Y2T428_ARAVE|nr:hypothetical protein AVEN_204793-1 [Araneus ventricosus]
MVLGKKIGIRCDRKLTFKDYKRKISHNFPYNEAPRCFIKWAPHGISDVLKYAGHPSDVNGSQENEKIQNAPTTSDKLEDKQKCRNDKPIITSPQTFKTVNSKNNSRSQKSSGRSIIRKIMT